MMAYVNVTRANTTQIAVSVHAVMHPYPQWLVIFLWLLTVVLSVETILGNMLVLLAYKLERNIRCQLSNKFIVSLAITDLIIGMEGFPLLTVYVVGRELWPLGDLLCQFWLFLDYTLCLVSILNVLLITVDRYGSVCYPAKYRIWQTRSRVKMFIFGSWIVPCVLFGMMIFAWEPMTGQGMDDSGKCYAPFLNDPYVNMMMYIIYYWTTLAAMFVLYRGIHTAAKALEDKSKARERQTIALLLGQRCMAQVGVGMLLHSSGSDEDDVVESFFHPHNTLDGGYGTEECTTAEMMRDSSSTNVTVANVIASGYEQFKDDDSPKPAIAASNSDEKRQSLPAILARTSDSTEGTPTKMKTRLQRNLLYKEFGEGDDEEDVSLAFVPLLDRMSDDKQSVIDAVASLPSSSSLFNNVSPSRGKIFGSNASKRSSGSRRVLAPMNSYGGVVSIASRARRAKLIGSFSLDEDKIEKCGSIPREYKSSIRARKSVVNNNTNLQKSLCSLNFYDSNDGSVGSLYCDASLHSVFEFGDFVSGVEPRETKLASAPDSMENSLVVSSTKRQPNGDLARTSTLSSLSSASKTSQSDSISTQSQLSTLDKQCASDHPTPTIALSTSSPAQLINVANEKTPLNTHSHSYTQIAPSRLPVQIKISPDAEILTPIMEEEKSTLSKANAHSYDSRRRESSASRGRQGTKRYRSDQKIVHLTVPGPQNRRPSTLSRKDIDSRRSTDASELDWHRGSWQSTASSIIDTSNHKRKSKRSNVEDDADSCDSGRANRRRNGEPTKSSNWLMNLFNNPTSILNRKRKVTKAERRARKAFRTITVIVGTFALFWSPYYIVATIYGFCPDCVPAPLFLTSYYLCYLNSSVNPFAYAFANRLFRKTFIRILRGDLRRT